MNELGLVNGVNDASTVRELWEAGYRKWALWKLCPYSLHNPKHLLGEEGYRWPVGCLRLVVLG